MTRAPSSTPANWRPALFTLSFIAFLAALAVYQVQPPAPVPASAPPQEFSSSRAMEHLKAIAQQPHPTGSPENARVREYILSQLKFLGLEPQVQTTTVVLSKAERPGLFHPAAAATVRNVLARLPGAKNKSSRSLLLAAHYDSVPSGPGASDDGAGVATLLETLRALEAGPPLRNDLIFLFTDGEEVGLLGAEAFVDEHPWAKDAAVAFNFEARGACGPSLMFETSSQNGWLVREFAKAAPHPVTSSLMYEVYKRLPNDTDFTIFKRAGIAGLNFAYLGCWPRYHTLGDNVEEIDERSLQHHGSYALALARHFGDLDLNPTAENDAVYFSLFRSTVFYPGAWVLPLMAATVLAFAVAVRLGFKRKRLTWHGTWLGCLAWLGATIVSAFLLTLAWWALRATHLVTVLPYGMAYNSELIAAGLLTVALAIILSAYIHSLRKVNGDELAVGALLGWAILSVLAGLFLPGVNYLFAWPLLFASIGLWLCFTGQAEPSIRKRILALLLTAIPETFLLGAMFYLLVITMSTSALGLTAAMLTLLLGPLAPAFEFIRGIPKWLLPGTAAAAGIVLIFAGLFTSRFDAKHPRPDNIFYVINADTGKAFWVSGDEAPDKWTSQFLSERFERSILSEFLPLPGRILEARAPALSLAAPNLTPLDDLTVGDTRILRLWLTSPRQARVSCVRLEKTRVEQAKVNGKAIPFSDNRPNGDTGAFFYVGLPKEGIELTFEVKANARLTIQVIDASKGLPEIPGMSFTPRPAGFMPAPGRFDSSTLVMKTFRFEPPS